jgi:pyruvate formate lyase activating enzyme
MSPAIPGDDGGPGTAPIFHIERHALHDGPGIRTLVFFKGCPLRCSWCSNPEGQDDAAELIFDRQKCAGCGACRAACPRRAVSLRDGKAVTDRSLCRLDACAAACVPACPAGARSVAGRAMSVEEVLSVIARDEVFYRYSEGGVTASGGEPLMHARFLGELFRRCRQQGIGTAVETCGEAPWEHFQHILPHTDLFLFDVKHMDAAKHRRRTGMSNERILANLHALSAAGKQIIVRVPVVPGFNDTAEDLRAIAVFVASLGGRRAVHLLPFHRLGISKYARLEREYPDAGLEPPPMPRIRELAETMQAAGVIVTVEV